MVTNPHWNSVAVAGPATSVSDDPPPRCRKTFATTAWPASCAALKGQWRVAAPHTTITPVDGCASRRPSHPSLQRAVARHPDEGFDGAPSDGTPSSPRHYPPRPPPLAAPRAKTSTTRANVTSAQPGSAPCLRLWQSARHPFPSTTRLQHSSLSSTSNASCSVAAAGLRIKPNALASFREASLVGRRC